VQPRKIIQLAALATRGRIEVCMVEEIDCWRECSYGEIFRSYFSLPESGLSFS
tara:strand:- start:1 stop:159 length:159 start_codon:yes stop_codon:yes gene_type:complete